MQRFGDLFPKIEPVPGSLQSELKACGKDGCRCARGELHGPYWSLRWREDGRLRRRYVRPSELERVQTAIDEWRRLHPPAYAARQQLAELRRLLHLLDRLGVE
jgi:hypothetical protein